MKKFIALLTLVMILCLMAAPALAADADKDSSEATTEATTDEGADNATGSKALAAGICVGIAALGGAIAMGTAIGKSNESIARQPEAEGTIRGNMMLGLVFIETAIIYALVVAILIIFVL